MSKKRKRINLTSKVKQEKVMEKKRGHGCGRTKIAECTGMHRSSMVETQKHLAKLQTTAMYEWKSRIYFVYYIHNSIA